MSKDKKRDRGVVFWATSLLAVALLVLTVLTGLFTYIPQERVSCTVLDKIVDGGTAYVSTKECGTLEIRNMLFTNIDTGVIFSRIEEGNTYLFDTIGARVRFLNTHATIIGVIER